MMIEIDFNSDEAIYIQLTNQIIMGIQPIDAFDEMVEYFKAHGALEMEEIYNEAEAAYQASLAE